MSTPEEFRVGDDRLLCDDWHAHGRIVVLRPRDPGTPVRGGAVRQVLDVLADRGVDRVLTAALDEDSLPPFADAGFHPHEDLCVLRHRLGPLPGPSGSCRVRRGSPRRDIAVAAAIDESAFTGGDMLDEYGLGAVLAATPVTRFRLACREELTAGGYAVAGIAAGRGYLQRIAVDPVHRRNGMARSLVLDALRWLRRRRVTEAFVNTQIDNHAARSLYRCTGFVPTGQYLAVWAWDRPGHP